MNGIGPWQQARRLVEHHLAQLRESLEIIGERLREALARAVSGAVANAVHELFQRAVTPSTGFDQPSSATWRRQHLDDGHRTPWETNDYDDEYEEYEHENFQESRPLPASLPTRWLQAAVVGCQTAAWLLRRRLGHLSLVTAIAIGVTASATVLVAGPTMVALAATLLASTS